MKNKLMLFVASSMIFRSLSTLTTAQHQTMPPGMTHEEHLAQLRKEAEMKKRGAAAMGFDQDTVVHHFFLTSEGGAIQVEVTNPSDQANRQMVRTHLEQIAQAFAAGNFDAPLVTHGEMPPGVATLQSMKGKVSYTYRETSDGGRIRIATEDADARAAIYDFLRYQITEHRTGDPLTAVK